jgi:hypothetical protein
MIANLSNINKVIKEEKLEICVISYGGSCSNELVNTLIQNNYICKTNIWNKILCHCPLYIPLDIPIIYIYSNPIKAFLSMKRRSKDIYNIKKLSNDKNKKISDEQFLQLMFRQFNSFIKANNENILIISSKELFENTIIDKLQKFLKREIKNFPIEYKTPVTNINNIDPYYITLFEKYKNQIDLINNLDINNIQSINNYLNETQIKCNRETCNYICHSNISNNGGTYCCRACKEKDIHGPACQKLIYSMISSTNPVDKHSSASQS